jgi:pescadillo protein
LADLDDALTLTYLFAALPTTSAIKAKMGAKAKSLAAAWGAYCSTAGSITKSFISVKGVYLEATIRGIPIRWIVPHSFTQFLPEDVDYRVMATFFEFYETLLHFVLFKLYNDMGVRYPLPEIEAGGEVKGSSTYILSANLRSLSNALKSSDGAINKVVSESLGDSNKQETSESTTTHKKSKEEKKKERELMKTVGAALENIEEDDDGLMDEDEEAGVDVAGPLKAALETMAEDEARTSNLGADLNLDDEALKRRRLFAGLTFFFSREVPRGYLELVGLAYGANVGWEGPNSPISVKDPSITHHIVDRPKLLTSYDSLPKSREFVQPQWILDCANNMFLLPIAKYGVGVALPPHLSPWVDNDEEGYKPAYAEEIERLKNGESIDEVEDDLEVDGSDAIADEDRADGNTDTEKEQDEEVSDDQDVDEDSSDDEAKKLSVEKKRTKEEKEAHELAKSMMSRKAAHLYGRMQHGIAKKQAKVDALASRRREIEHSKEKDESGKTPLKQKVERLKKERKRIEDEYSNTGGSMKKSKKKRRT